MVPRSFGQPALDERRLVGAIVVHDDMHSEVCWDSRIDGVEELVEFLGAVAWLTLPDDRPGPGVEGGKQGVGAMADIVMGAPFHLARSHGQQGAGAAHGLDLGGFSSTHSTRARSGGCSIEADDVPRLLDEQRVAGELEGLRRMALQAEGAPDAVGRAPAEPDLRRQGAGDPVGRIPRGLLQGRGQHPFHLGVAHGPRGARPGFVQQAIQAPLQEPSPPLAHGGPTHLQLSGHQGVALARCAPQDHAGRATPALGPSWDGVPNCSKDRRAGSKQ